MHNKKSIRRTLYSKIVKSILILFLLYFIFSINANSAEVSVTCIYDNSSINKDFRKLDFMKNEEITIVYDDKNQELKKYEYQYSAINFRYMQQDYSTIAWILELENMKKYRYVYDLNIRNIDFFRSASLSKLRFKKEGNELEIGHYFDCEKSY